MHTASYRTELPRDEAIEAMISYDKLRRMPCLQLFCHCPGKENVSALPFIVISPWLARADPSFLRINLEVQPKARFDFKNAQSTLLK
jgi:hypothetical protein